MASIYKRNSVWWGRVFRKGKLHRRSLRTTDRSEANRRLMKWVSQIDEKSWASQYQQVAGGPNAEQLVSCIRTANPETLILVMSAVQMRWAELMTR